MLDASLLPKLSRGDARLLARDFRGWLRASEASFSALAIGRIRKGATRAVRRTLTANRPPCCQSLYPHLATHRLLDPRPARERIERERFVYARRGQGRVVLGGARIIINKNRSD